MPVNLIIQLVTTFGPGAVKLIELLIKKYETNGTVTSAEWADVITATQQTANDRMVKVLQKAGIALDSPQAVALLALSK